MNKKTWDKLENGTILIRKWLYTNGFLVFAKVNKNRVLYLADWDAPNSKDFDTDECVWSNNQFVEIAPKWISELYEIA